MADQLPAINAKKLLIYQSAPGRGQVFVDLPRLKTFNASIRGTGVVSATINILGSNLPDADTYVVLATLTLSGTTLALESGVVDAPWAYTQAELVSVSGNNPLVNLALGV